MHRGERLCIFASPRMHITSSFLLFCWTMKPSCTVTQGRHFCFCEFLLDSVLACDAKMGQFPSDPRLYLPRQGLTTTEQRVPPSSSSSPHGYSTTPPLCTAMWSIAAMEVLSSMSHPVAAGGEPGREDTDDASDRRLTEEEDDQTLFLFLFFDASFPCSVMLLYICLPPIWAMGHGDGPCITLPPRQNVAGPQATPCICTTYSSPRHFQFAFFSEEFMHTCSHD
jgi:hypothetical protein